MAGMKDKGEGAQKKKKQGAVVFFRPERFYDIKKAQGEKRVDQGGAKPEKKTGGNPPAQQIEQVKKRDQQERNSGEMERTVSAGMDHAVQGDLNRQIFEIGFVLQIVLQVEIAVIDQALGDHDIVGLIAGKVDAPGVQGDRRTGKDQEGKEPYLPGFKAIQGDSTASVSTALGKDQNVNQH